MGETRIMHYVPQGYLQYFSQERNGQFYIHAMPKDGGIIFSPNIKNVCAERDMYALPGATEEERQLLEKIYNDLYEAGYARLYEMLTDPKKDGITAEERYSVVGFVVSMFFRNNSWHNFLGRVMDDILKKAYTVTKESGNDRFHFEEREVSITGKTLEQIQQENRSEARPVTALAAAHAMFKLIRVRVEHDYISVIKARDGYEFITSDNPVIAQPPKTNRRLVPMDPGNSLWLPIDNKHLLTLNPWAVELDWSLLGRMEDGPFPGTYSSTNNHFQQKQAGKFLLGSETSLKAFAANPAGILAGRRI